MHTTFFYINLSYDQKIYIFFYPVFSCFNFSFIYLFIYAHSETKYTFSFITTQVKPLDNYTQNLI